MVSRDYRSPRAHLLWRTRRAHEKAEAVHWSPEGFRGRSGYIAFLRAMLGAHTALGVPSARVRRCSDSEERETFLIEQLFVDLGGIVDTGVLARDGAPRMGEDFAWGVAYALSGSALGAVAILRSGHVLGDWPVNYLDAARRYASTGLLRRLFDDLDAFQPDLSDATAGALAVFDIVAGKHGDTTPVLVRS